MDFAPGCLVIYKTRCAVVSARNGEKFEIRIEGGDSKNVRAKDMVWLHRGPVSALPPETLPDPNGEELAELMDGEQIPFGDFLELAYGADTPAAAWSAWQLLARNIWFSGSPEDGVCARERAAVESALAAIRERELAAERRVALLERIRNGALLPEDRPAMREIEHVARGETPSSRIMHELKIEAIPEKAHQLLLRTGVWDEWVDPWPARFGVPTGDPELPLPESAGEERTDLTAMAAYAIDDADSGDPDDAIGFADGLLWVHVADPLAAIQDDDPVDREARQRGANLYLPEGISHMLPPEATRRFGLGLQEISPALSFALSIDDDGRAVLEKMMLSRVRVTRCDYDGAGHLLTGELAPVQAMLARFRRRRAEEGALFIDLPEVKIRIVDGQIRVIPLPLLPVRELVANAMLACGSAVAQYLADREVAVPYAVQPPPEEPEEGIPDGLPLMFARRRGCAPGVLQSFPGRHAGLGLEPYVRVTSPLRRYEDLLAHRQLRRLIKGETPLTSDEIDAALTFSEPAALERRKLERRVNEFWLLTWMAQHPDWSGACVAAARQDDRLTWLIPELAYEFKNRFDDGVRLGEERRCVPVTVDPVTLTCRMRIEKAVDPEA